VTESPSSSPTRNVLRAPSSCLSDDLSDELLHVPFAHVAERGGDRIDLELAGCLPDAWAVRLSRSFAARGISLQSGYGRRVEPGRWQVRLELANVRRADSALDYLQLALRHEGGARFRERPILDFVLSRPAARGGSLELEVHAWDALGLLAGVLGQVAAADLVADEIGLEIEGECAFHSLILVSPSGSAPTQEHRRRLAAGLCGLLRSG